MNIGGGSAADMAARFNENRGKLRKRPDAKTRMRQRLAEGFTNRKTHLYRDEIAPQVMAKVKGEIREMYRREKRRNILLTFFSVFIAVIVTLLVYLWFADILREWFFGR